MTHPVAQGAAEDQELPLPGAIYACPMHPQIRQTGPGACSICGMALEPVLGAPEPGAPDQVTRPRREMM